VRASLVLALLLASASLAAGAEPRPAAWFEYLHVEANEGDSSGGHVAIRFGEQVFHFQHHAGGLLRLARDDARHFLHVYTRLRNRTVHVQRVAVDADVLARLRARFGARLLADDERFATLAALEAERDLLATAAGGGTPHVTVRGGAFFDEGVPDAEPLRPDVAARAMYGVDGDALARRAGEITDALAHLRIEATTASGPAHDADLQTTAYTQKLGELLEAELALRVLRTASALAPRTLRDEPLAALALTGAERGALARHAERLATRAGALATSQRPDFGSVLLLTLARRAALERSLARGHLIVLDAYPPDAQRLEGDALRAEEDHLPLLLAAAEGELAAARRALVRAPEDEARLTALEAAVNRYLELHGAVAARRPLRLARGTLLPVGSAERAVLQPLGDATSAGVAAERAARAAGDYRAELRDAIGYDLLTRNCVSEVFHEITAALSETDGTRDGSPRDTPEACAGSTHALGGCIDPAARLRFIPFVSAAAVADEYRVAATLEVPSYRSSRLDEMYAAENDLLVLLRESNVVTSSLYRVRDDDSAFLFFSDDTPLLRPLLGTVNLAVGLGASAAGLVTLPADGGALLRRGTRGALFSLPELAFVAIRKGSFAYAPPAPALTEPLPASSAATGPS